MPARALAEAGADLDRIVEVLAQHTDHTRALLRLQVAELVVVAERMVALAADSKEMVVKVYNKALELGATDEGAAGPRMEGFYAGYFRDLDGNKLNVFYMEMPE